MADDGFGIIAAGLHADARENFHHCFPRTIQPFVRQLREFGTPAADVIAVRIKFFALSHGIENTGKGGGIPAAALHRRSQRRIVGEPQIKAQPDEV